MKTIVDLGYGREELSKLYSSTDMSSRLFYGLAQLSDDYAIKHVSLDSTGGLKSFVINNFRSLTKCDVLYLTYFFPIPLLLLAILKKLGFYRQRKIVVVSHKSLVRKNILYKAVFDALDKVFFHSIKNLEESVMAGTICRERAEFLYWGDDLDYIDAHYSPTQGGFFLSTGREQRDYPILIHSFSQSEAVLELYTNRVNYSNNYEYLDAEQDKFSNIKIIFVDKTIDTSRLLAKKTAECLCVVNPLIEDQITYCVGLTSIVEAMALGKPVISSYNPYSPVDIENEHIGFVVNDEKLWIHAINYLHTHRKEAQEMGNRARLLAESKFNIKACARQLSRYLESL